MEDSIVSTLGVVIGMAVGTDSRYVVILSSLIVIIVESLSMASGSYLSNKSEREMQYANGQTATKKEKSNFFFESLIDSLFMGVSYIIGGFFSILPFFLLDPKTAILPSVVLSTIILFSLGLVKGKYAKVNPIKSGLEMSLISLSAAALGFIIGTLARSYLNI